MKRGRLLLITVLLSLSTAVSLVNCGGGGGGGGGGGTPPPPVSSNANLASLATSHGLVNPSFDPTTTVYASMFIGQTSITSYADSGGCRCNDHGQWGSRGIGYISLKQFH